VEAQRRKLVEKGNDFLNQMIEAKKTWEELVEMGSSENRITVEDCPHKFQSLFAMYGNSEFNTAIPRMIDYVKMYGGFEIFLSEIEEEEEEEE